MRRNDSEAATDLGGNGVWHWCAVLILAALLLALWPRAGATAPRLPERHFTNGDAVRGAFRDTIAEPRQATVRVLSNGGDAALGTIVDPAGWILTKASQLKGRLVCQLADGRELPAKIVGVHTGFDLAMLKLDLETTGLPVVRWNQQADPQIGAWMATPGLDEVPVAIGVLSVARRKIAHEKGVLGISIGEADLGPRVTRVFPNSGADAAGLKVGDIITQVAGKAIETGAVLTSQLGRFRPGDWLTIRVLRESRPFDLRARLGYPLESIWNRRSFQNRIGGELSIRRAGFPQALQHDTVLRPQDCGGPVVDLDGTAVGINIARAGRTATYAIPASEILPLLDELKSGRLAPTPAEQPANRPAPPRHAEEVVAE